MTRKPATTRVVAGRIPGAARVLAELRRSSAAGSHGKRRPDRANIRRRAIERDERDE